MIFFSSVSLLSRIIRVTEEVVQYREWVESKWGEVTLVPYSLHQQPVKTPTYATVATRHVPMDRSHDSGLIKNRVRPLSRSQSNVEFLVSQYQQEEQQNSVIARPSSSDSLVTLSSGLTIDLPRDLRLSSYKDSTLADSPTAAAPSKKSKDSDNNLESCSGQNMSPGLTSSHVKDTHNKSSVVDTIVKPNGLLVESKVTNHVHQDKKTNKIQGSIVSNNLDQIFVLICIICI